MCSVGRFVARLGAGGRLRRWLVYLANKGNNVGSGIFLSVFVVPLAGLPVHKDNFKNKL